MLRNLDKRVEALFPIDDEQLKEKTVEILNILLSDNKNARIQDSNGEYHRADRRGKKILDSQSELFTLFRREKEEKERELNVPGDKKGMFIPLTSSDMQDRI